MGADSFKLMGWLLILAGLVGACDGPADPAARARALPLGGHDPAVLGVQKFVPADGRQWAELGVAVAVSGDTVLVGAHQDDDLGPAAGAVYVLARSGGSAWKLQQKLTASDGGKYDRFGSAADIQGDTALVAALYSPSPVNYYFGMGAAMSGATVILGASRDRDRGKTSGSAYVFIRTGTTWAEQQKLTASDGKAGDRFGFAVAIKGASILVGAHDVDDQGVDSGAVYQFVRSGMIWAQQAKITAPDGKAGVRFSWSVALGEGSAMMGAPYSNEHGLGSGAAYFFKAPHSCVKAMPDAGPPDAAVQDAGLPDAAAADARVPDTAPRLPDMTPTPAPPPAPDQGCRCSPGTGSGSPLPLFMLLILAAFRRRRRR